MQVVDLYMHVGQKSQQQHVAGTMDRDTSTRIHLHAAGAEGVTESCSQKTNP